VSSLLPHSLREQCRAIQRQAHLHFKTAPASQIQTCELYVVHTKLGVHSNFLDMCFFECTCIINNDACNRKLRVQVDDMIVLSGSCVTNQAVMTAARQQLEAGDISQ